MDYKEPRRMALRGLHHLTAICQDLERTTAFYRDVLGLTLVSDAVNADDPSARHFWFSFGGSARTTLVSFMEYPDLEPGQIGVGATHHFAFLVETAEEHQAWFDYLRECGVQCSEIFDRDGFRSLYLRDPDGHIIEIATRGWDFA
jgi:catechol 2,3-dioxygenase-like lactoylglutathione lyase family enzyme